MELIVECKDQKSLSEICEIKYSLPEFNFFVVDAGNKEIKRLKSCRFVKSFLAYVPYAVLSAMTFPEILYSTGNMVSAVFGLLAALLLAYKGKGLLTVAVGAVAVVFVVEQVMQFIC